MRASWCTIKGPFVSLLRTLIRTLQDAVLRLFSYQEELGGIATALLAETVAPLVCLCIRLIPAANCMGHLCVAHVAC
jgi:putative aminopeptidase FrvX